MLANLTHMRAQSKQLRSCVSRASAVPLPPQRQSPMASSIWQKFLDEEGTPYYTQESTGISSWTMPPEFLTQPQFEQLRDEKTGSLYYCHLATGL